MADYEEHEEQPQHAEETREGNCYRPDVDIVENDEAITICADMPGVAEGDIEVHLEDEVLSLYGKVAGEDDTELTPIHTEYRAGDYRRRFMVSGDIDPEKIEGHMSNGVLELVLAKRAHARPRRIPISGR
jgi:HSP20 family protein